MRVGEVRLHLSLLCLTFAQWLTLNPEAHHLLLLRIVYDVVW